MSVASKLFMGWSGVTITPPTPAGAINCDEITQVQVGKQGSVKKFYGDTNPFPSLAVVREKSRTLSITTGRVSQIAALTEGTVCTVVAILNDAQNGIGTGAVTVTLANAVVVSNPFSGSVNEFATGTIQFEAYSLDGTDPMTLAVAS